MKNPWFKFYPTDWRSHAKLRNCGAAARGLWIEMLCLMHEAKPYGHLLINGEMPTITQLSMQAAIPETQIPDLLGELEKSGVFSRNGKGVIYSRKMVRDEKKAAIARNNGNNGGNPTLSNKTGNSASVNRPDKPPDKGGVKAQNPSPDPDFKNPPLPPSRANGGVEGFDVLNLISEDGLMDARAMAPRWDIQGFLVPIYNEGVRSGKLEKPRSPNKAFPAWCKSYTKGKLPQ